MRVLPTDNLAAVFLDDDPEDPDDFQYWLVLKTSSSPAISSGNLFWVIISISIISLIYISRKRAK